MSIKEDKAWFESWFDSDYYHILYNKRNELEASAFIQNLTSFLNTPTDHLLLDLACGRGRHTDQIAKLGYHITGIDLSQSNIEYCKSRQLPNAEFYVQDMRKVFRTNYFNLILNLFTSFGYFNSKHENEMVLESVSRSLKNDGIFVLDYLNVTKALKSLPSEENYQMNGIQFSINKVRENPFVRKYIDVEDGEEQHHFYEQVSILNKNDLLSMFDKQKLKIIAIFGDYQLSAFDEEHSDRLILIAQKNK